MVRLNVSRGDCLNVFLSKLSPKARDAVAQIACEPSCTYLDVKRKLLDDVGTDIRVVENQLFVEWRVVAKGWDMVTRLEKLKSLVDRFVLGAKSVDELALRLINAIYMIDLSTSAIAVVVGKNVKTFSDLSEVASVLKSSGEIPNTTTIIKPDVMRICTLQHLYVISFIRCVILVVDCYLQIYITSKLLQTPVMYCKH